MKLTFSCFPPIYNLQQYLLLNTDEIDLHGYY